MPETRESGSMHLEARIAPSTVDADARTVEVVFTTGAPVERRDYWTGESWVEELEVSERAIDMARLNAGAPFLNSHRAYTLGDVIGVVERAWVANGEGRALLRFSERQEVAPIFADVRSGILRNISVGYNVAEWKETKREDGVRIKRAIRWTPAEISLVSIPADVSAQVRAAEAPHKAPASGNQPTKEGRMADIETKVPDAPAETDHSAAVSQALTNERARMADLDVATSLASGGGIAPAVVSELRGKAVSEGWTGERLRSALFEAAVQAGEKVRAPTPTPTIQVGRSGDDPAGIVASMAAALAVRAMPTLASAQKDARWREYAALRPSEMLLELAVSRGERVSPRNRMDLIERAFHTTSDFPLLLELSGNKMLEAGYEAAAPSYRTFFAQRSFSNFQKHKFLTIGDFPGLSEIVEGGEITAGTISEKREEIQAKTYGRQVRITRQMMINDDLGAFTDFGAMIGRRIADQENALAYALLNTAAGDGPTLATGAAAVFGVAASRGNKAAAGATISEASLDAGYAGMMAQASLDGIKLNIRPRFLLTGSAYRGSAIRFTTRISPESAANVGLYSDLAPIADANIPGNRWYLFADPASAPVYVYGYVNGATAPQVRTHQYVPGTDGLAVEVVHDFAVGAIDHRGGWFNPGA